MKSLLPVSFFRSQHLYRRNTLPALLRLRNGRLTCLTRWIRPHWTICESDQLISYSCSSFFGLTWRYARRFVPTLTSTVPKGFRVDVHPPVGISCHLIYRCLRHACVSTLVGIKYQFNDVPEIFVQTTACEGALLATHLYAVTLENTSYLGKLFKLLREYMRYSQTFNIRLNP